MVYDIPAAVVSAMKSPSNQELGVGVHTGHWRHWLFPPSRNILDESVFVSSLPLTFSKDRS